MEVNKQKYNTPKSHGYIAPFQGPWEEDLWYYDVFDPKYLLNNMKAGYESKEVNTFKNQ